MARSHFPIPRSPESLIAIARSLDRFWAAMELRGEIKGNAITGESLRATRS